MTDTLVFGQHSHGGLIQDTYVLQLDRHWWFPKALAHYRRCTLFNVHIQEVLEHRLFYLCAP